MTWGSRSYAVVGGGDDEDLLRAVVYGNGMWIATGWKLLTSTDGVNWTDHGKLNQSTGIKIGGCNVVEGLAFNAGAFYACCELSDSKGTVFKSTDGMTWEKISTIGDAGDTGTHLFLNYRGGKFIAYGDTHTTFTSTDAINWTVVGGVQEGTYCQNAVKSRQDCKDSSWWDGVFLRADWRSAISRSTDGNTFTRVYDDDKQNGLYDSRAIAAGYVAP